jgi:hypothetical protein
MQKSVGTRTLGSKPNIQGYTPASRPEVWNRSSPARTGSEERRFLEGFAPTAPRWFESSSEPESNRPIWIPRQILVDEMMPESSRKLSSGRPSSAEFRAKRVFGKLKEAPRAFTGHILEFGSYRTQMQGAASLHSPI